MDADVGHRSERQLHDELQKSIQVAIGDSRPILRHLNADTTWLLSLPYPTDAEVPLGRLRYNILIDPWFQGPQVDYARWFSTQHHAEKSYVQTVSELNSILSKSESARSPCSSQDETVRTTTQANFIDAVVISHEFTDHCHRQTLLEVPSYVPVFATYKAYNLIRSWKHFDSISEITTMAKTLDWRETSQQPLPPWIGLTRLVTKWDPGYLHSAVVVLIKRPRSQNEAEAVIYTPHGVEAGTFSFLQSAQPQIHALALLHGLDDISLSVLSRLNLGAINALKAQKQIRAKYWIRTHDEKKTADGIIGSILRRKSFDWYNASKTNKRELEKLGIDEKSILDAQTAYRELGNGDSLVLE